MPVINEQWQVPDSEALAHSQRLSHYLQDIIAEQGSIPFSRFMHEALYAPGLGYYSAGARKFGAAGDFVTAPEISSLFAQCVATQARQVLLEVAGDILELGAGSGVLAANVLEALAAENCLPEHYFILEPSADLRDRQRYQLNERQPELLERVIWLDEPPADLCGFVFGNEVVDAFPVERFLIVRGDVKQLNVAFEDGNFCWRPIAPSAQLHDAVREIEKDLGFCFSDGYCSELNLLLQPWMAIMAGILKQGALVLLDYGYTRREYYMPERRTGSLRCYYRHRAHENPFLWPGLQDITSHVDFTALTAAAVDAGLELQGFTPQAQFLLATQLLIHAENSPADSVLERSKISRDIQQMTMPGTMGDSFSAIGFSRGIDPLLMGFSGVDRSYQL